MRAKLVVYTLILFLSLTSSSVYADGLGTLIQVGKSQDAMERALRQETKVYEAVKKGVETGTIDKGETQDAIRKNYGDPVVVLSEKNNTEKWVYKPGYTSHFDGIKIYLFFDEDKKLIGIKMLNRKK